MDTVVQFTKDCYPYCKGDTIVLSEAEVKDVDALAKRRGMSKPYKVISTEAPVEVEPEAEETKTAKEEE
jgi:hypothetical protein